MSHEIKYTLSNGRIITAKQLAAEMNLKLPTAQARLKRSNDIAFIFGLTSELTGTVKVLSDGRKVTLVEVMRKTGLSLSAAKKRFYRYTDPLLILAPHRLSANRPIKQKSMVMKSDWQ